MTDNKEEVKEEIKQEEKHEDCKCKENDKKCCHEHKKHNHDNNKLKEKEAEIEKLKKELEESVKKVQYAQAELVNYRKRKDDEVASYKKYCNQDLITELIPIVDNFERAISLDDNNLTDELSKFLHGFKMMYASLTEVLRKFGVEEISRAGEVFDSNLEEALMTDNIDSVDDDIVTEVLLKGYKLKDRVIRPASVKINKKD
ncbi:MAG: nucleotide exchange factor GrpE [bacterium]|nr:nucleotide exchange factor GrpE [bacterium]